MGLYCDLLRLPHTAIDGCTRLRDNEEALVRHIQDSAVEWLSLDKAWHGLHVLLNAGYPDAPFPKGFLFHGGVLLSDREWAELYGVAAPDLRLFTAQDVRAISAAIGGITQRALLLAYDPARLLRHDVYPRIWEKRTEWLRWSLARIFRVSTPAHYLVDNFGQLQAFIGRGAAAGDGLVVKYHQ